MVNHLIKERQECLISHTDSQKKTYTHTNMLFRKYNYYKLLGCFLIQFPHTYLQLLFVRPVTQ